MTEERKYIPFDEAVKLLPDRPMIHTFRTAGPIMLGADHERDKLIEAMKAADQIHITGPGAQAMKHGLAIFDENGPLFIEAANADQASPTDIRE